MCVSVNACMFVFLCGPALNCQLIQGVTFSTLSSGGSEERNEWRDVPEGNSVTDTNRESRHSTLSTTLVFVRYKNKTYSLL